MCSEHNDFKLKCFYPNLLVPIIKKSLFLHFSLYKWKNVFSANAMYSYKKQIIYSVLY